jgi:outer membrane protein insertion porin family
MLVRIHFLYLLLFALLSASCKVTDKLREDEYLLVKNKLELENLDKDINKPQLTYSLGGNFRQVQNKKNFFFFRANILAWYKHKDRTNRRWSRFMMKKIAEAPVIYKDKEAQRTALNMQNSMRLRGYFDAKCRYSTEFGRKTASVTYTLDVGQQYRIKNLEYTTSDSVIMPLLPKLRAESLLANGKPVSSDLFNAEKLRITDTLKNNGFAFFVPNHVDFTGDSSNLSVNVKLQILPPTDSTFHKRIYVDEIVVLSNVVPGFNDIRRDTTIQGVYFISGEKKFSVKPKVVYDAIQFKPGQLYRQSDFDRTYRNLSTLGVYRLVSIKSAKDSSQLDHLDLSIALSPNRRVTFGGDLESYTITGGEFNRLFGISSGVFLRNRNIGGGAENFQTNLLYGVNLNLSEIATSPIFSQELRLLNSLTVPRFLDYLGLWGAVNRIRVGDRHLIDRLYKRMQRDGKAQFTGSLNALELSDQFRNASLNLSFGYILTNQKANTEYRWNHIGLDILRVTTRPAFDTILDRSPFLKRSLGDQLFTGFLLRDFSVSYYSTNQANRQSWSARLATEVSGAEVNIANKLWNIPYPGTKFKLQGLDFATFARIDTDFGFSYPISTANGLVLVTHAGASAITPFGPSKEVPYVKQLIVGGPNSLRAWRNRELGPGSYRDATPVARNQYYQAGDFRLEMNAELRFNLVYWFKGAIFLDAGNIWTLKTDERGQEARLSPKFIQQMAVGTGFGLRADFDYFIFRFDAGLKVRNPYPDTDGSHFVLKNISRKSFNPNIAIGYPFSR